MLNSSTSPPMDPDEVLRRALRVTGGDLWSLLDATIAVAVRDHAPDLRARRDAIVERLFATPALPAPTASLCRNCGAQQLLIRSSPEEHHVPFHHNDDEKDDHGNHNAAATTSSPSLQTKIMAIRDSLEDPDQSEESLLRLLQNLADMDITYPALKETDIGRVVNGLRKHPSEQVQQLVKQLVREWKDLVSKWVNKPNHSGTRSTAINAYGDTTPEKIASKGQASDCKQCPCGSSPDVLGFDAKKPILSEASKPILSEPKPRGGPTIEAASKLQHATASSSVPGAKSKDQDNSYPYDSAKLDSARKRLHENYQEAENAKRQRTIQVMDLQDIPKPKKNAFFRRGGGTHPKHH